MNKAEDSYWLKIAGYAITVLLTIVLSMSGFWFMLGREFVTRNEASVMIGDKIAMTSYQLDQHTNENKIMRQVIEKNTEALSQLKVELSAINQTVKFIEQNKNVAKSN